MKAALLSLLTRWPLRLTLPVVLLGGALLIAVGQYHWLMREHHTALLNDSRTQFQARSAVLTHEIEAALERDDGAAIDALFEALSAEYGLVHAELRTPEGRLAAHTTAAPPAAAGSEVLPIQRAVRFPRAAGRGNLSLAYDLAPRLADMRGDERRHLAYRLLLAGSLTAVLWVFLDRIVVRRLREFERQAVRVRNGQFDIPGEIVGNDELSALGHALRQTADVIGRDRASLLARDQRMAQVEAAAELVVWELDIALQRIVLSERWARMLGYAAGVREMSTAEYMALIDPRDLPAARDLFKGYVTGRQPNYISEYRLRDVQGRTLWVLDRGTAVSEGQDGRKVHMVGVQLEISARKQADLQHRALLEAIPDLLVVVDADGTYREYHTVDPGKWIGPPSTMVGRRVADLLPPGPARISMAAVQRVLESGAPLDGQYEIDLPHGHRWREFRMVPYGSGQVLALVRDVTARKEAEQAVRNSEGRLRAMIENFPIGMFWCDAQGNTLFTNAALRDHTSATLYDVPVGWRWLEAIHPDDRERMERAWRDFVIGARSEYIEECRYISKHRGERLVRTWATPVRVDERTVSYVGAAIDISEQRAAEVQQRQLQQQLHHAQKMEALGALTGGIAHDFNNILASILGFAGLARQYFVADPHSKLANYLDAVLAAGERGRELISKMLIFSRARPSEAASAIDAAPVLQEVVGMLRAILPSTIKLTLDMDAVVPAIAIDATELHQLVVNLTVNARDAIDGHGEITVGLKGLCALEATCSSCQQHFTGSYVELCVGDTGGVLAAEVRARMFEPFFSTKEVGQGTGLGLAVVHGVMHRAGGHVLVASHAEVGTRMRLLFQPAQTELVERAAVESGPRAQGPTARILLVDDEEQVTRVLSELLCADGHRVDSFTCAADALAAFEAAPSQYDVIITDQTMPAMTGLELAAAVRAVRADLPVILCSGYSERVNAENYAEFGLRSYCNKPVTSSRLREVLNAALAPAATAALEASS